MPFDKDIAYHMTACDEMAAKGYSPAYNAEMAVLYTEKQDFFLAFPSRKARRRARKEGIKVGRWY